TSPFVLTTWLIVFAVHHVQGRGAPTPVATVADTQMSAGLVATSALKAMSQVFFIDNWAAGAIILVALAARSQWAAALALGGSTVATLLAYAIGVDAASISTGAVGFSAALSAIALGCVFATPTPVVMLHALYSTVLTVTVQLLLGPALVYAG